MDQFYTGKRRWKVVRPIGQGGQGRVFLAIDVGGQLTEEQIGSQLYSSLRILTAMGEANADTKAHHLGIVTASVRSLASIGNGPLGALKELLELDRSINSAATMERFRREVDYLQTEHHPSLIRVLDANVDKGWMVTEYFPGGPLDVSSARYRGDALGALLALRPVIEAVAVLHRAGVVHRDIKPDNLFVSVTGGLVLGDFGIAIKLAHEDRLTDTYEKAGSTDWMPPWAMSLRLEDVTPEFDVFCIAKVLWAMVSGKSKLQLWYWDRPANRVSLQFPGDPGMEWLERLLAKTLVQEAKDCLPDAAAMLREVDEMILSLQHGGQLASHHGRRCRFCGVGHYEKLEGQRAPGPHADQIYYTYRCGRCGHLAEFMWVARSAPELFKHD